MSEREYDGILSFIATLINIYSFKDKEIKLNFSNKFETIDELYVAMGAMIAQISGKEVSANLGFFTRRKLGKKYKCKIKKLKTEGIDVSKLKKVIEVSYKDTLDIEYLKAEDVLTYYLKSKGK